MKHFRTSFLALLLIGSLFTNAVAQMMGGHAPPVPMTVSQFASARTGQNVRIAVRVERKKRATVNGELLEQKTASVSKASGKHVVLYLPDDTPAVMGTASDIVPGAVLFVFGVLTKPWYVDVKRVVIDSKFIRVQ